MLGRRIRGEMGETENREEGERITALGGNEENRIIAVSESIVL